MTDLCRALPTAPYLQQFCLLPKGHTENGPPHQNYGGHSWFDAHEHKWSEWANGSGGARYRFCLHPYCDDGEIK